VEVRNGPPRASLATATVRLGDLADLRVVFLGSMSPQDGVEALPELLALLRSTHGLSGARMVLIGDGPSRPEIEAAFARRGLGGAADFRGRIPHDDVPEALAEADVCVDPAGPSTLNHRSTMVKVAEYLAAARPVVAYDLIETRRTAADAAVLVEPGDVVALAAAVAQLAHSPEDRDALAQRARERAEGLVWEHSERNLVAAYDRLLDTMPTGVLGRLRVVGGKR
jgi:glycosyltransferase involved in cell wall biosynthesis